MSNQTEQEAFRGASLADAKKEMVFPRMTQSARHALSQQSRRPNQPMRSNREALPKISFDLGGLVTLNESFATGEAIFNRGDIAETLMYIQRGRVKLSVASKTGKEAIVAILGSGDFLGEACLGSQNIRLRTATAIVPTALKVIERNEMIRALHADHALSYCFLSYVLSRKIQIEDDFVDQVSQCGERRLARALLLLAGKGNQRRLHKFAGITQATLATMIGTTRSRVNFFMNKFRTRGFVRYQGPFDANGGLHVNTSLLTKALRE
ncbi:MAG TPA: Crp/Fnr family transcriptional regulator [Candidatus Sulfotelmatobacter sp.]|nr:Crp/Fnr family transcriptional regulator [Candidatus Sulfotelmatobacter sp.]